MILRAISLLMAARHKSWVWGDCSRSGARFTKPHLRICVSVLLCAQDRRENKLQSRVYLSSWLVSSPVCEDQDLISNSRPTIKVLPAVAVVLRINGERSAQTKCVVILQYILSTQITHQRNADIFLFVFSFFFQIMLLHFPVSLETSVIRASMCMCVLGNRRLHGSLLDPLWSLLYPHLWPRTHRGLIRSTKPPRGSNQNWSRTEHLQCYSYPTEPGWFMSMKIKLPLGVFSL